MSWKPVDHYILDVEIVEIPDEVLGDFKCLMALKQNLGISIQN